MYPETSLKTGSSQVLRSFLSDSSRRHCPRGNGITSSITTSVSDAIRSEEHTSELQSRQYLECRVHTRPLSSHSVPSFFFLFFFFFIFAGAYFVRAAMASRHQSQLLSPTQ